MIDKIKQRIKTFLNKYRTKWTITFTIVLINTLLHAIVGAFCGLIAIIPLCVIELIYFIPLAFFFLTIAYQNAQYQKRPKDQKWNWVDSIVDIVAGNAGFHIVYWLIIWIFG